MVDRMVTGPPPTPPVLNTMLVAVGPRAVLFPPGYGAVPETLDG